MFAKSTLKKTPYSVVGALFLCALVSSLAFGEDTANNDSYLPPSQPQKIDPETLEDLSPAEQYNKYQQQKKLAPAPSTNTPRVQKRYEAPKQVTPPPRQTYQAPRPAPRKTYQAPQQTYHAPPPPAAPGVIEDGAYSDSEIINAGHGFFGAISKSMGKAIEKLFRKQGRPNGYILGEEAGGAIIAGLRYGEGTLYTKNAGTHRIYWQGPSVGYDFGASGSKTLILVYDLKRLRDAYGHFGGINGSAFLIGGVGVTLLKRHHVTMAPIRSGLGLRLGANVGYLKFTSKPTWNPF